MPQPPIGSPSREVSPGKKLRHIPQTRLESAPSLSTRSERHLGQTRRVFFFPLASLASRGVSAPTGQRIPQPGVWHCSDSTSATAFLGEGLQAGDHLLPLGPQPRAESNPGNERQGIEQPPPRGYPVFLAELPAPTDGHQEPPEEEPSL